MTKQKYKNPPIVEAVCEIRFPADNKWGMNSFIKFANSAEKAGFPNVVDAAEGFQINFQMGNESEPPSLKPVSRRIQTWNKGQTALWQASSELFAANHKIPYLGWKKFRPHIQKGFDLYAHVAQPKKAERFSLHYINRIEFASEESPARYVKFVPPDIRYADSIETIFCHTQQVFINGDIIQLTSARDPNFESGLAVILNLIYTKVSPPLDKVGFKQALELGHQRLIDAFEQTITDEQRLRMVEI